MLMGRGCGIYDLKCSLDMLKSIFYISWCPIIHHASARYRWLFDIMWQVSGRSWEILCRWWSQFEAPQVDASRQRDREREMGMWDIYSSSDPIHFYHHLRLHSQLHSSIVFLSPLFVWGWDIFSRKDRKGRMWVLKKCKNPSNTCTWWRWDDRSGTGQESPTPPSILLS